MFIVGVQESKWGEISMWWGVGGGRSEGGNEWRGMWEWGVWAWVTSVRVANKREGVRVPSLSPYPLLPPSLSPSPLLPPHFPPSLFPPFFSASPPLFFSFPSFSFLLPSFFLHPSFPSCFLRVFLIIYHLLKQAPNTNPVNPGNLSENAFLDKFPGFIFLF